MGSTLVTTLVAGGFTLLAALVAGVFTLRARAASKAKVRVLHAGSTRPPPRTSVVTGTVPPSSTTTLGVGVVEVEVATSAIALDHPVVDIKIQNQGGRNAYLTTMSVEVLWAEEFDLLEDLLPYLDTSGPMHLPASALYEIDLPGPPRRESTSFSVGISQTVSPGESDRILIRTRTTFATAAFSPGTLPASTGVYLLRFGFHNGDRCVARTRSIGIACPGNVLYVPTVLGLKKNIYRFEELVLQTRERVEADLKLTGERIPTWRKVGAGRRRELVTGSSHLARVNDSFWEPARAIQDYLTRAETGCRHLVDSLASDMPDQLDEARKAAADTLAAIPELRAAMARSGPFVSSRRGR